MKRLLALCAVLVCALLGAHLCAHELPTERKLIVDVGADNVEMMLVYQHPKSDAVTLLFQKYDIDGDGSLTGEEARLAGREWMPRMLHGLEFEVAGERPKASEPKIKFRREDDGGLSAAAYITWSVDPLDAGKARAFHVRMKRMNEAPETMVDLRAADPLTVQSFESNGVAHPTSAPTSLEIGDQATLIVRQPSSDQRSTEKNPRN